MCVVNMSFEVPDARHIDIEALKKQVNNYVGYLLAVPGIVWQEDEDKDAVSTELLDRLQIARNEIQNGHCVKCCNPEELNAFLDSL